MRTAWGYDVNGTLAPILSVNDFTAMTGMQASDRIESALNAASQAIRNYCGWHITPSIKCTANPSGGEVVAKLPAGYVSSIESVTENGTALAATDYQWRKDGLLKHVLPCRWCDAWDGIEVVYNAGYEADAVPDLVEAVCAIASGVLAVAPGVSSESADGVTISYSASAASVAAALTSQQRNALEPYKLRSSHAA